MISIIIPCFNRAHLICETLDSIINQTYSNWECIIVDDHSEDNTEIVVADYVKKDNRFSFFKKPKNLPKGPSASRNYGFSKSKGNYINWLDSDDLMHPEKLEIDLKNIQSGDYDFTISQSEFFTDDGTSPTKKFWNKNLWSDDPINDFILKKIGWSTNAPLWKKKSLIKSNLYFDIELITSDDYLYHIQALLNNLKPIVNKCSLIKQREHNQRLNEFKVKSPFKLKVNLYLMNNANSLNLNNKVIAFLNLQFLNQISNLLKNKRPEIAKKYLNPDYLKKYSSHTQRKVKKLYLIGVLYNYLGVGYRFLNIK
jgi:glycosyltransferase involved in cell wall biosynthesis